MPTSVRTTVSAVCTTRQKLQLLHCDVSLSRNHGRTCSLSLCGYGVQRRPPLLLLVAHDQPAPQPQPHNHSLRVTWTLAWTLAWGTTWAQPGAQPGSQSGPSTMGLLGLYIRALTGVPARDHAAGFRMRPGKPRVGPELAPTASPPPGVQGPQSFATWEGRWRVEGDHPLRLFRRAAVLGAIFRDGAMRP